MKDPAAMVQITKFNPETLYDTPSPYRQVARVKASETIYIAGQIALDKDGKLVGEGDFEKQCAQVHDNITAALKAVGTDWRNVVELTSYLVRSEDIAAYTAFRKRELIKLIPDGAFPPNTLLVISSLASPAFLLEVKATAAI